MRRQEREYSKILAAVVVVPITAVAVGFVVFICYEMHRLQDLSPAAYIGGGLVALLAAVVKCYMDRAAKKSETDLKWEETKRLTLFREKHPEYFTRGDVTYDDIPIDEGGTGDG